MPAFEPTPDEPRLESWKAIAAYLNRDVRTAKRWEVREGLPVHRHQHQSRSSVYAYPREIDLWREGRKPAGATAASDGSNPRRPWLMLAAALVVSVLTAGGDMAPIRGLAQAPANTPTLHCEECADFYGSVSPDGRTMAIVTPLGNVDIGLHDIATGEVTPLRIAGSETQTSAIIAPVFSPDGNWIAYTSGPQPVELRVVRRQAGATPATVINNPEFDYLEAVGWADPETIVVFVRRPDRTWEVGTVPRAGGAVTRIKSLGWRTPGAIHSASVSPDGRHVAYAVLATNPEQPMTPQQGRRLQRQLYVLPLDESGDEVALTSGSGIKDNPVWMPDGKHVLFTSNVTGTNDLWAAPVADGKPAGQARLVRKDIGDIASLGMSASGVFHYYEGRAGVFRTEFASLGSGGSAALAPFIGHRPTWSPDGRRIAVSRDRPGGDGLDLVVRDVEKGSELVYSIPGLLTIPFDWFPDGRRLLVATTGPILQIFDPETRVLTPVPGQDPEAERRAPNVRALSQDGATIYQSVFRPQPDPNAPAVQDRLIAIDVETGSVRPVLTLPIADESLPRNAQSFALAVSPDDRQLALALFDRELRATRIATVNVDGSGYRKLVPPVVAQRLRNKLLWSPDGNWIYAVAGGREEDDLKFRVIRIPAMGGAVEETGIEIERLNAMSISPDGTTLAYSTLKPEGWGELLWSLDVAAILGSGR
jgi:Tol biopolymer transport system component